MRWIIDGDSIKAEPGDSVLVALLRAGLHPTGGGCLCLAGDCSHCLATVDGVAYTRTCQVPARAGSVIERQHAEGGRPPLIQDAVRGDDPASSVDARHLWCDVAVIGQGSAGRAEAAAARSAGKAVVTLDAGEGHEVVGIYPGPLVVARSDEATLLVHVRDEVVVATGAAEIQPVAPGAELDGLLTARAASALAAAGLDLGRVVAIGSPPDGVEAETLSGEVVRFEGSRRVEAIVVRDAAGDERRVACDTVSLGLGLHSRDALLRMGRGLPVRAVGDAARPSDIPPCPRAGMVCACAGVTVDDLESVWDRGFHELELVKRATLAGTGTCQGSACLPHLRSFLQAKGRTLQSPFTARPVTRQPTVAEIAAGADHRPTPRTALHDEHLEAGAIMERAGGWWRPWTYGDRDAEMRAVRGAVSLGDVGTLGKFLLVGSDAASFLDRLYPTRMSTLKPGRFRYALLLDERGYVADDGLVCRVAEDRFYLTLTSAGATFGELWIRDWAEAHGADVRLLNQTRSLGAINVTGPRAGELLARAGVDALPRFGRHRTTEVAGVACRVLRLGFTGELSFELHHAAAESIRLWRTLMALGADLGIRPHGLDALFGLRLEKGHLIVGQDTDFDSTPRRLDHAWAIRSDADFIGRQALRRTDAVPLDRQLVGLAMDRPAPAEGSVVRHNGAYVGYVTSSTASPARGDAVMLAWLDLVDGELPERVTIDGRPARRVPTPFYDPDGARMRAPIDLDSTSAMPLPDLGPVDEDLGRFDRLDGTRIVAVPEALDEIEPPAGALALRVAPDEVLITTACRADLPSPSIVERETGFAAAWLDRAEADPFFERACAWELPSEYPAFAQGAMADLPVHLWLEADRVLIVVPAAYAVELTERMA